MVLRTLAEHRLTPGGRIVIADISFRTTEALARARDKWGKLWDDEYYWIAEEVVPACEAMHLQIKYEQVSEVAGVYVLLPDEPAHG